MDNNAPSMLKPTLIGGLACGVVAGLVKGIPIVSCACCLLIIGAGFLAAYLYSNECKRAGAGFSAGNGAMVGLVAGLFYAVGSTVAGAVWGTLNEEEVDMIIEQMEQSGAPAEAIDMIVRFLELISSGIGILVVFCFTLLFAAIFSTIGGLIGASVFKVQAAAPPDAGAPPPPPPIGGSTPPPPPPTGGGTSGT